MVERGFDGGCIAVAGGPVTYTADDGYRLPHTAAIAARHLGPPPWEPTQVAPALVLAHAIEGIHRYDPQGYDLAPRKGETGFAWLGVELDDIHGVPARLRRVEKVLRAITVAHRRLEVAAELPTWRQTWPTLALDPSSGEVAVALEVGPPLLAGPAVELPARWTLLAQRLRISSGPEGWARAAGVPTTTRR